MGSGSVHWNVFDGVKIITATPEALMAEIDSAISNLEYSRATALLEADEGYDAHMADEAYKAGCAALAAGKLDEALRSRSPPPIRPPLSLNSTRSSPSLLTTFFKSLPNDTAWLLSLRSRESSSSVKILSS
ncbi:hypothetical protein glysoja_008734 [Glycine soja]|nr:hypothetical protein glysoja_008734 [Glycine soja]